MAKAKNIVVAGDYQGKTVTAIPCITLGFRKTVNINAETVASYELITDEHRKSVASGVARGIVGGFLLGPVGMLAGGVSAKNKGVYTVAIEFKDGKRSLVEVDDKIYKAIVRKCF